MHSRIASQSSKAPTPITSSFGVKPQTVQTVKERNNKAPDPKFNFNLSQIAASRPSTPPARPQVNLKHHLQLAQNNPVRELQRQKQRENKIKTVNLKSFTSDNFGCRSNHLVLPLLFLLV
ncbi:MAG: hypothetical protein QNJ18_21315 [Xenococcaceae cyanobacterium MO_167.B52]|nr:hypothetical protein [Xenococcaceae cyanobacterium MO_167.B52]